MKISAGSGWAGHGFHPSSCRTLSGVRIPVSALILEYQERFDFVFALSHETKNTTN